MKPPRLYLGTAGWSYKDWVPNFYPKNQSKSFDWLAFYAQYFNVVEVNSTYYTYMNPNSVKSWIEKVEHNNDFKFTLKLHQDFTHKRNLSDEKIQVVKYNFDILAKAEKLGGILFQFPYSFPFDESSTEYVLKLNEIFQEYTQFIEVRHLSWNNKQAFEMLKKNNISLCTIDQPQLGKSIKFEPVITNDKAYFRFHGRNVKEWFKSIKNFGKEQTYEQASERYKYLYSPAELFDIENKIKETYDKVKEVFLIMNNHPSTYGIVNAFELLYMLSNRNKINIPENTIQAFNRLQQLKLNFDK